MTTAHKNLIIRVDAGEKIGAGHLMRCIALAQAWQDLSGNVTFLSHCDNDILCKRVIDEGFNLIPIDKPHPDPSDIIQTLSLLKHHALCSMPSAPPWYILDGYHFTPDYQKAIRENGYKLLIIDDMAHLDHYHADILLNQNIHASSLQYSCDRDTVKLLGCKYVLLRREFWSWHGWKRTISKKARKILVTMGGGDPDNVTSKVIEAIKLLSNPNLEVRVVVGPSNPYLFELKHAILRAPCSIRFVVNTSNMPELMAWADVGILAGGSTCWEIAFMGLPTLIITISDNQVGIAEGLGSAGAAVDLSWHVNISVNQCARALEEILQDKNKRACLSEQGQEVINGKGRQNVMRAMLAEQIKLRKAQENDCELLWKWANDLEARAVSFTSAPISWEDHTHWFNSKLNDGNCMMYVAAMNDGTPLGQIRYDIKQRNAVISISIDGKFRSKGYGVVLIRETAERLFNESNIRRVHAYVKQDNNASSNVFSKAGFKKLELTTIDAQQAYHFVLDRFTS